LDPHHIQTEEEIEGLSPIPSQQDLAEEPQEENFDLE